MEKNTRENNAVAGGSSFYPEGFPFICIYESNKKVISVTRDNFCSGSLFTEAEASPTGGTSSLHQQIEQFVLGFFIFFSHILLTVHI